ncbi:tetratricopeptide repeat protein [Accumulibacter sp.]|uniref:tetratricopeptide repeat protein n=1 Tax=Accumulibacter sp. TaxID=2053492 RepID=UPI00260E1BC8|nr:tetratricopeptide repeat protein [Accumulibacter sp.]
MLSSFPRPLPASFTTLLGGLLLSCALAPALADDLTDGQRLMKQGQLPQALEKADAYVSSKPKDPQGRFLKGVILTEMGRSAEAMAVFVKLTEDFPELPEPYNNLAVLHAQQKQYDKARTALDMAIRTHPGYATAYENLGDVYAKLASQSYDKALQLEPSNKGLRSKQSMVRELIAASASAVARPASAARPASEAGQAGGSAKAPVARSGDRPAQ